MSRLKVKCATCRKVFTPSNAKQTLCPDCGQAQRAAKAQKRMEVGAPAQTLQPSAPLILGPGASVLRRDALPAEALGIPPAPETPPPDAIPAEQPAQLDAQSTTTSATHSGRNGAGSTSSRRASRVTHAPFVLSDALRQRIEERYLALANPVEFDGIRTQIADELGAPKPAVRAVVREVRARRGMLSWWEAQGFSGTADDLGRIKTAYTPYLPLPPVGIHREIAVALAMEPRAVYRGIRKIRALMGLPQYNTADTQGEHVAVVVETDPGEDAAHVLDVSDCVSSE
jgi:hypothetical protein